MPQIIDEIPSTQDELKKRILSGKHYPHLDYLLAHNQSKGKGRLDRPWISAPGNLYLSFWLAHYRLPLTWIPHWIALSLVDTFLEFGVPRDRIAVKWPNDLIIDQTQKIAGILCEKIGEGVLIGVGANLLQAPALGDRETSYLLKLAPDLEPGNLNLRFMKVLLEKVSTEPNLPDLRYQYERVSLLKSGQNLSWLDLQTQVQGEGQFLKYGEFGELMVRDASSVRALYSEEIKLK